MQAITSQQPAVYNGPGEILNLARKLEELRQNSLDYVVEGEDLFCTVVQPDEIDFGQPPAVSNVCFSWVMDGQDHSLPLTGWAQRQVAEDCNIPILYWNRMLNGQKDQLLSDNVNTWLPDMTGRRLRTLPGSIRAVVSNRFKALDNYDVLITAVQAANGSKATVKKADVTESRMFVRMVDEVNTIHLGDGSEVHPGVVLRNSDVGNGALIAAPYFWRQVCSNGAIWTGTGGIREIHLGNKQEAGILSPETIAAEGELTFRKVGDVVTTIFHDQDKLEAFVQSMDDSLGVRIKEPPKVVESMALKRQINKTEAELILAALVQDQTIAPEFRGTEFALKQAVSSVARDHKDPDRATELEMLATSLKIEEL